MVLSRCYRARRLTLILPRVRQSSRNMSIDLSLDRIRRLQALLPPYTRPTCHITGTNGKGSVAALLSSIFQAATPAPAIVGRFNSPHLVSVQDCITLNNKEVPAKEYAVTRSRVEQANAAHQIGASNFELLTCTALQIFEGARADIVILEVGMGGRLDATNIIPDEAVLVSALTAVDLDHQAFLGNTVAAIAREKAGIARPGKPFVLGQQTHAEVEGVVRETVGRAGGDVHLAPVVARRAWDAAIDGPQPTTSAVPLPQPIEAHLPCFSDALRALLPLHGEHQLANLGTALGVISALRMHSSCAHLPLFEHLTTEAVVRGIQSTEWPGRLSFHELAVNNSGQLLVLADGAHNPASARTLAAYISSWLSIRTDTGLRNAITFLLALSHSPPKSPIETLDPLLSVCKSHQVDLGVALLRFSPPEGMPWVQPVSLPTLRAVVAKLAPDAEVWSLNDERTVSGELQSAFKWAAKRHEREDGLVIVAGSLYLVADFYRLLKEGEMLEES